MKWYLSPLFFFPALWSAFLSALLRSPRSTIDLFLPLKPEEACEHYEAQIPSVSPWALLIHSKISLKEVVD